MLEKPTTAPAEREGINGLERYIENLAESYRAEGVPLGNDGRIDMEQYADVYFDVKKDLQRNQEWQEEWQKQGSTIDRRETDGEQLEMLAYAIFAKNLGEQFIVTRSSPHDDRANKVDTLLLERATGNLVCAFDEVGDTSGTAYERKLSTIQEHNLKGGARLKYGLGIVEEDGKRKIVKAFANNVPLFYVALPKDRIGKGIKEFSPETDKQSDFEEKLFAYFVATLSAQVKGLELYSGRLNGDLKMKLSAFKKVLADVSAKREKKK
jgi:hypothetical protein